MKTIAIGFCMALPCILAFNDSDAIIYNIIGVAYMLVLYKLSHTKRGAAFCRRFYTDFTKLTNKVFK